MAKSRNFCHFSNNIGYFCKQKVGSIMSKSKSKSYSPHPVVALNTEIEQRGVLLIEDVKSLPSSDIPFVSPHLVIVICHQGYSIGEYDMKPIQFRAHDYSLVYPDHPILAKETSEDYRSTLLIVSSSYYKELRPRLTYRNSLLFHSQPCFHLSEEHYNCICDTIRLLRSILSFDYPSRKELTIGILDVMSRLVDSFRQMDDITEEQQLDANSIGGSLLFKKFYDLLSLHYKENREVQYYAQLLCLSPKYFGSLIKKELGISAVQCIANYVVIQAKTMLHYRPDLTIQQISQQLGFDDSTSFSRYFKASEGISPKKYREQLYH
jgi:AraC-like DNA-binding protein